MSIRAAPAAKKKIGREHAMAWTKPTLTEVCIGLEVTGYESAE